MKKLPNASLLHAVEEVFPNEPKTWMTAHLEAAITSSVKAVIPGRQQKKNVDPLLQLAFKAAARTLRRRARS